jgi:2-polyprenyl-3-methyl-5-hydroxy-6-metoxy-1,4-benzoquinol methylase
MNEIKVISCPVCINGSGTFYTDTKALMHKANNERFIFDKCNSCDTVYLTNPVSESDLELYYTDNYLPYQGDEAWGRYQFFVKKSQEYLDLKRAKIVSNVISTKKSFSILDVGCGNPSFLATVQKKLSADCTGIDFSANGWKDKNFQSITLLNTSLADFVPNQKFDIITLWHYLEHDYNLQETVGKLHRCLNPNGKLIIEIPDYDSLTARRQKQFWQGWHSPRHLTLFSTKGLRTLFAADKWSIVKHNRFGTLDAFRLWWLGNMEKKNVDWAGSMQGEFWSLVFLKVISFPFFLFERFVPMGIQLIVFEKR